MGNVDEGVGTTLRRARGRRKVDLSEVEATTKIRGRYLRAIEAEDWDALPGEAYVRGFIRTYASYLGLDGEQLIDRYFHERGIAQPAERLPLVEPGAAATAPRRRGWTPGPRLLATLVSAALIAVVIAIGLSGREDGSPVVSDRVAQPQPREATTDDESEPAPTSLTGLSLQLAARGEVWVCLLDSTGRALVDGQILTAGSEAGPFRSGSFTVSFGNGEVAMTMNGQQASIPATPSPIGYAIGASGELRELSEGERPTCT